MLLLLLLLLLVLLVLELLLTVIFCRMFRINILGWTTSIVSISVPETKTLLRGLSSVI